MIRAKFYGLNDLEGKTIVDTERRTIETTPVDFAGTSATRVGYIEIQFHDGSTQTFAVVVAKKNDKVTLAKATG